MTLNTLYEHDIHAWTQQTVELLRQQRFRELDIEHLVEELECMGRRDRQELVSRLKILLGHLLKWQYQPAHRSGYWRGSILEQRLRIRDLLEDCPSLKPFFPEAVGSAYDDGLRLASRETGLPFGHFQRLYPMRWIRCWMMIGCPRTLDRVPSGPFGPAGSPPHTRVEMPPRTLPRPDSTPGAGLRWIPHHEGPLNATGNYPHAMAC